MHVIEKNLLSKKSDRGLAMIRHPHSMKKKCSDPRDNKRKMWCLSLCAFHGWCLNPAKVPNDLLIKRQIKFKRLDEHSKYHF